MSRSLLLAERRTGIGGTDAAAILGHHKYRSPLAVWCEKTGRKNDEGLAYNKSAAEWGNRLEPVIAEAYHDTTKREVSLSDVMVRSAELEAAIAHLDFMTDYPSGVDAHGEGPLEIKTANQYLMGDWQFEGDPSQGPQTLHTEDGDELVLPNIVAAPLQYVIQLQHYMRVTGFEHGTLAVLIGGQTFGFMDVEHNSDFTDALFEKVDEFWSYVKADKMPPVPFVPGDYDVLQRAFVPDDERTPVELGDEGDALIDEIHQAMNDRDMADDAIKIAKAKIVARMTSAALAGTSAGKKVTNRITTTKPSTCKNCNAVVRVGFSRRVLRLPNRSK